jgi:diguanylate cyclase (GGDEF)-like protein
MPPQRVPARALVISIAALAVPVTATLVAPEWQDEMGLLLWLTALVPAFLFAYYRGMRGVATALAGAMVVMVGTQTILQLSGDPLPPFELLLGIVAVLIGISVGIAAFAEILHRERNAAAAQALQDGLTGLPNRRHAEVFLTAQFAAAGRGRRLVVLLFDLDHFKKVNDAHGHAAGDDVIRAFAQILRRNTRRMDLAARFGGEEFVAILTDNEPEDALVYAERMRRELKELRFPWGGSVTVSIGAAAYAPGMGTWEVMLAAADRALYDAKAAGRDRIAVAPHFGADRQLERLVRRASTAPAAAKPGEHVVVVDDDPDVLRTLTAILRKSGYEVEATDDPHGLLRRWKNGAVKVDLLLTDIMMPAMNGLTLVDRMTQIRPGLRVIYMSGYIHRDVSWDGLPGEVVGMLEKPIEMDDLLGTVRAVLEKETDTVKTRGPGETDVD